jgi:hypothetical protein
MHDSPNNITSIMQVIVVTTANGQPIQAGQANKLVLSSGKAKVALKGALLVAQDQNGVRQGSFTDNGKTNTFVPFPGCGKNPQGKLAAVIQQMGISATVSFLSPPPPSKIPQIIFPARKCMLMCAKQGSYSNLVYNAPACLQGNVVKMGGLAVTGAGFGQWTYTFNVTGSQCSGQTNGGSAAATGSATNTTVSTSTTSAQAQAAKAKVPTSAKAKVATPSAQAKVATPSAQAKAAAPSAQAKAATPSAQAKVAAPSAQANPTGRFQKRPSTSAAASDPECNDMKKKKKRYLLW